MSKLRYDIASQIRENREWVLANSLKNCHAFGVHSVAINVANGCLRRVFVARDWHELWKNNFGDRRDYSIYTLSVAVHPHHCGVKLTGLKGAALHVEFAETPPDANSRWMEYEYVSPIGNERGSFRPICRASLTVIDRQKLFEDRCVEMMPRQLHTVFLEKREQAAWLVEEGLEDPYYKARCFSNDPRLERFDFTGMYRPMSPDTLDEIVEYLSK